MGNRCPPSRGQAGINVPEARALHLGEGPHAPFLARRFDRAPDGGRIPFVSAMTLTPRTAGESDASYLELVDLVQSRGADTAHDCKELVRRVLFSILIHNTDDHLRNQGFLISERGLSLSPAYAINPTIARNNPSLAINEIETACDVAIAIDSCKAYGISTRHADVLLQRVRAVVSEWQAVASRLEIPKSAQNLMSRACPI